ncbi:ATP-binding protein [Microbacterium panaciterrae]|uniref:Bacterial transcriptional activator domain-containing protein n=1 Tax=Microbacterium panaciterrae TaxID=985759 RepID=A0ABP8PAI9_9MICO
MTARIGVLGPVRIADRDAGGAPMRALLAALVIAGRGATRSVATLADDIWGEDGPQHPKAALQTLVSRARALAGADAILSVPGGYALGTDDTDLADARGMLARASTLAETDPRRCEMLAAAADLWRGDPGADLGAAPIAEDLAHAAAALRTDIDLRRAEALTAIGDAQGAASVLDALAAGHPIDEGIHLALMEAFDAAGRSSDALAVFARLRTTLRETLGSSPGSAITERNARLLRAQDDGPRVRIGVQAAPNALIGRDEALAEARALLGRTRLLTIVGAGGLGKTRVAQALAGESDAPVVIVVALAGVRADAGVPVAIAAALGISENTASRRLGDTRPRPDLGARIAGALSDRATLLVLDNCEQVIDGAAQWAAELLAAVPSLRILTTSRTALSIAAERVLALDPLGIDATTEAPAVRLFLERAHAARPGARLDLDVVARLCERLDGLPLAIELAAARVRTMTPAQIEARLENRFALLTTGDRSAPARHRTLEAVIEWSWDLLASDTQRALAMLSVLPGGFSAATAAAILGGSAADDILDRLAGHSLLTVIASADDSEMRFRMLETVREFGYDRLQDSAGVDAAWEAVIAWAVAFATRHGFGARTFPAGLTSHAHRAITEEHDNLVHVMRHLIADGRNADAVRLFTVLGQSWFIRGSFTEFIGYARPMIEVTEAVPDGALDVDIVIIALAMGALGCMISGDPIAARGLALVRIRAETVGDLLAPAWQVLTGALISSGRGVATGASFASAPEGSDPRALLASDILLSHAAENDGEVDTAAEAARTAWERARVLDERWAEGMAADLAAQLAAQSDRPGEAMTWMARATTVFEEFDAQDQISQQEWVRGGALLCLGRSAEARTLFQRLADDGGMSQDGLELSSIGAYGLAEADLLDGDIAGAAASYARAMQSFADPVQRRSPWYLMALSGYLSAATRSLGLPVAELGIWERRLRTRTIAVCRQRREGVDRPVLGTALLGWSAWALRTAGLQDRGVDAVAFAEALGGRQNMPTLNLARHVADAERIAGADAVARARADAARSGAGERVTRGLAALGHLPA